MVNINFVPDDYVQSSESRKTNLIYLVLFLVIMVILGGTFMVIKVRQKAIGAKEKIVNGNIRLRNSVYRMTRGPDKYSFLW